MAGGIPPSAITVEPTDTAGGVVRERERKRERKRANRRCHAMKFIHDRSTRQRTVSRTRQIGIKNGSTINFIRLSYINRSDPHQADIQYVRASIRVGAGVILHICFFLSLIFLLCLHILHGILHIDLYIAACYFLSFLPPISAIFPSSTPYTTTLYDHQDQRTTTYHHEHHLHARHARMSRHSDNIRLLPQPRR